MGLEDIYLKLTEDEAAAAVADARRLRTSRRSPMGNVLAIAGKELRGYFASPIAYVMLGFFALVYGWFFYVPLAFFNRQSMQMGMGMGGQHEHQLDAHRRRS